MGGQASSPDTPRFCFCEWGVPMALPLSTSLLVGTHTKILWPWSYTFCPGHASGCSLQDRGHTGCVSSLPALLLAGRVPSAMSLTPAPVLHTPHLLVKEAKGQSSGLYPGLWSWWGRVELESRVDALPTAGPHWSSQQLYRYIPATEPFKDGRVRTGGVSDHSQGHMTSLTEDPGEWVDGNS